MTNRNVPEVGQWYAHRDKGQLFQVVAYDEDSGLIELQDFEGDVDTWLEMPLAPAAAPEDWSGPVDLDADEAFAAGERPDRDWRGPIDGLPAAPQDLAEGDLDDEDLAFR